MAAWTADTEPYAYGELALKPWEYERLTAREFGRLVEGYQQRERIQLAQLAQLAAWVAAPHLKLSDQRKMTPSRLLGARLWAKLLRQE